ncbi:hypothetical protein YC2023_007478 [Brassica napus]
MSSKLDKAILIGSLCFCFKHSTNEQDSVNYIKEKHAEKQVELYREDKINALYEHITTKHTNYQVEAESRCSLRKMMTHENEWITKDKMKVIQSRLTLLSQSTRALLEIGEKKDVYKGEKNVGKQKSD